ncbi:MAG: hypothetical protein RL215_1191, partial [Planctomycetota bacterium]
PAAGYSRGAAAAAVEQPQLLGHSGWVVSLEVSPDGSRLVSADSWGRLTLRSMESADLPVLWSHAEAHAGWIRQAVFSSDGQRLASCGVDGMVRVWSAADGKLEQEFSGGGDDLYSLACHPDGETAVVGDLKGLIRRYRLRDGGCVQTFEATDFYKLSYIQDVGGVRTLAFSADGKVLAAGGCIPENGGFVQGIPGLRLFSTDDAQLLQALRLGDNQEGFVHQVLEHPLGYWMGVCSGQPGKGQLFLHRQGDETPFCVHRESLSNCHSLVLHPAGRELAVAANAGTYGQQKSMAREGNYPGNTSPIHVLELPA